MNRSLIESAWDQRDTLDLDDLPLNAAVNEVLHALDQGELRVAMPQDGGWQVQDWVKKAILLSFRLHKNQLNAQHPGAYDKVPLKFAHWDAQDFHQQGIRAVPGSVVRRGAYIGRNVVLMPSFVNIGAYVDEGTMVDTWATIGSCAQVGKRCHISGGTGIGGVLEPLQSRPVVIEDGCFIGARSEVVEGVRVCAGAVIGMGVFLGMSTPIVNRQTGEISYGTVPPYAVVIAGSMPGKPMGNGQPGPHLSCAVIVKQVDERTRSKTSVNDLLRA